MDTISQIVAAFVGGSLCVAALMRNLRSPVGLSFALLAAVMLFHDALSVIEAIGAASADIRLHAASVLILGVATLSLLFQVLPAYRDSLRRWVIVYFGFCALGMIFLALGPRSSDRVIWIVSHFQFVFPAAVTIFYLGKAQRETRLTRHRLRLRAAYWGAILTCLAFVTDIASFLGANVPVLGTWARIFYLLFIFQTFVQRQLVTLEELVGKLFLFTALAFTLSMIYFLLVTWIGERGGSFFFNSVVASFVIVILFDPIRRWSGMLTRKLFLRRHAALEAQLSELTQNLRGTFDPQLLSQKLEVTLKKCLGVQSLALFVTDRDELSLYEVAPDGGGLGREVLVSDPLVEYMSLRAGKPFLVETIQNDKESFSASQPRHFFEDCKRSMRSIGVDFILPCYQDSKLMGFVAADAGESPTLSNEQLRLFLPLGRQVAMLLRNAQMHAVLRDREKLAAVGEMAAGLAHEIRNPLGAIQGAAQLLRDSKSNEEFINIITDETKRLNNVLSEFLDYAKPRGNYSNLQCDLYRVISHTSELVSRESDVSISLEIAQGLPTIEVDPDSLRQVLLNLLLNASQAMDGVQGGAQIVVRARAPRPGVRFFQDSLPWLKVWEGWQNPASERKRPIVEIEVADNGPGIAAKDLSKIFVPFYTTKPDGTGLGLAICQRIVEGMGGTIQVRRNRPQGSLFVLHLPVSREQSNERAESLRPKLLHEVTA